MNRVQQRSVFQDIMNHPWLLPLMLVMVGAVAVSVLLWVLVASPFILAIQLHRWITKPRPRPIELPELRRLLSSPTDGAYDRCYGRVVFDSEGKVCITESVK